MEGAPRERSALNKLPYSLVPNRGASTALNNSQHNPDAAHCQILLIRVALKESTPEGWPATGTFESPPLRAEHTRTYA